MSSLADKQREIQEELAKKCTECGSTDLKETYYDHDGSLEGRRCNDCGEWQQKIVLVKGDVCSSCGSPRLRKMFDSANRWVMNKCMDCGKMD